MSRVKELEDKALEKRKALNRAILSGESQVQKFYDDAVVFVTGGSGFIGKQLIEKLMRSTNVKKIYMLVRPKKGKSIEDRIKLILENPVFDVVREEKPSFKDKIVGVEGDVCEINLGINDKSWDRLADEVTVIMHAAATISFVEPMKVATLTNIRGTREVLKLGKACRNIKAIVHVSTAYANATKNRIEGEVVEDFCDSPINPDTLIELAENVQEATLDEMIAPIMEQWPNSYTFTKNVTEELVRRHAGLLPICIVRPAIVISAFEEPAPGWIDPQSIMGTSGFLVGISLGVTHTMLSRKDIKVDLVPVDIVNNAIIASAWECNKKYNRGDKNIKIYTVTGTRDPIIWGDIYGLVYDGKKDLMPSEAIWYAFVIETEYKFIFVFLSWLLHYIPALIFDGCRMLVGKKPRLFKIYKLSDTLSAVFRYFMSNYWIFHDSNTVSLYNKLSDTDKLLYNCNMSSVDMKKMIFTWCYGVTKYIVKVDFSKTEYALKKQFWLRIVHYIVFPIYLFSLYKIAHIAFALIYKIIAMFFL
ncbi:fatty acyl-CoA reductase wat-like [Vanessa cardui]|uniref:fatty acyl-CoA reductase wat-like n=1 Tax=Vanessa cardui TaxID=171605 RepID=UPI001F12CAAA|nr:fatty acyl-CoA reductase wat-like [Vanessa cardui]XP_046975959.1 fatty acyl-CoA reductase wat-like [Vanessa cardui]